MLVKDVSYNGEEDTSSMENGKAPVAVEETLMETTADSSTKDASYPTVVTPPVIQGDGSKKSFASIVSTDGISLRSVMN